ncbi:hypothetical protein FOYG_13171 [Fusarium oxysporum NRRL 32931]|uniref:Uncharacterized protein n=1 Tax=Fusarium oxysporum NRRL 32931 TaxID=660029 RepID=W9HSX7_FUSOX|nr:hypothetical protein FOYG_13171 [Fusarium oxysporum NRRL 32931]
MISGDKDRLSLLSSEVHIRIHGGGTQPAYISALIK